MVDLREQRLGADRPHTLTARYNLALYANAAAQVRHTFSTLTKQEPKSTEDGVRKMEDVLKGVTSVVDPSKPLFAVSVQWENADQAEAIVKTTVGVVGGGVLFYVRRHVGADRRSLTTEGRVATPMNPWRVL